MTNNSRSDANTTNNNINRNSMVRILRSVERDINHAPTCCKTVADCRWYNTSISAIIRAERNALNDTADCYL